MTPRELPKDLLLQVWKEVGRHDEIGESLERLAPILSREVVFERLTVRRIDKELGRIETAAVAGERGAALQGTARAVFSSDDALRVFDWARRARVAVWTRGERDPLRALLEPAADDRTLIAGPLVDRGQPIGVLLVTGAHDALSADAPLVEALLEPLGVALANDLRLQELARLREAAEADNRALLSRLQREDISDSVVGEKTGLRIVMERVEQVARTDAPVLILGETGSGKEVVARAIHARSRRADGPFLRVNCGAIPSELVDSELFGHEKGSFTGAVATRRGWFERADGGTLFLDELGELPAAAQVRLLRVLQDGSFERVGGQRSLHVDVRIVAATHRDMQTLVSGAAFRQDLWYRVNVFPIRLPPLRERREDLPPLIDHFIHLSAAQLGCQRPAVTDDAMTQLASYRWPGNIRELQNVIERSVILCETENFSVDESWLSRKPLVHDPESHSQKLAAQEKEMIEAALRESGGRVSGPTGAAAKLGLHRSTLESKIISLKINKYGFKTGNSSKAS